MNHFKKSNKKLEKLRGIFFQIGLIVAGGLTLLAFEWQSSYKLDVPVGSDGPEEAPIELPPITYQPNPVKPKVKIVQPKFDPDHFVIVKNLPEPAPVVNPAPVVEPEFVPEYTEPITTPAPPEIFTIVEKMPTFVGGNKARIKYLNEELHYPKPELQAGIGGTVYLKFLVNKKGEIKDVEVMRGVSPRIDKEAVRVVQAMPNWKPGKQRGKAVDVSFNFRIKFESH